MNLNDAKTASQNIRSALLPACDRIEIAGSIRRGSERPGDIDIVLVLRPGRPAVEFGQKNPIFKTHLDTLLYDLEQQHLILGTSGGDKLKKFEVDITKWGVAGAIPVVVKMQITIATPETWAYWFVIRTGPAEFSHWLVTPQVSGGALPEGMYFKDCLLHTKSGNAYPENEKYLFEAIGLDWIEPTERKPQWRRP